MAEKQAEKQEEEVYQDTPGLFEMVKMAIYGLVKMILSFTRGGEEFAGMIEDLSATGRNMAHGQREVQAVRVKLSKAQELEKLKKRFPDIKID